MTTIKIGLFRFQRENEKDVGVVGGLRPPTTPTIFGIASRHPMRGDELVAALNQWNSADI
jgi:hypothetical protein